MADLLEELGKCLSLSFLKVILQFLSGLIQGGKLLVQVTQVFLRLGKGGLLLGSGILEGFQLPVQICQFLLTDLELCFHSGDVLDYLVKLAVASFTLGQSC